MKVIAKDDIGYPEYPYLNWKKDQEYDCWENNHILHIVDEKGVRFNFTGKARIRLPEVFEFIDE